MILKDFECKKCGIFEQLCNINDCQMFCSCGKLCKSVITKVNLPSSVDSFNPHYDLQLGKHFETKEEKEKFLKKTGRVQLSGPPSPRKSNKTSIICSKSQSKKEFGLRKLNNREVNHGSRSNDS